MDLLDLYLKSWAEPELGRHNWHCNYVLLPLRWGLEDSSTEHDDTSNPLYPVKLIILDSIAAPTRRDFGGGSAPQRVEAIFKIAQNLKRIATQLRVAIVVINQIDKMEGASSFQFSASDFVSVTTALGTSWHHCVTTRVSLEHKRDPHRDDSVLAMQVSQQLRRAIWSGHLLCHLKLLRWEYAQ